MNPTPFVCRLSRVVRTPRRKAGPRGTGGKAGRCEVRPQADAMGEA